MDAVEPLMRGIQIGMDIGQQVDSTVICVAERQLRDWHWPDPNRRGPEDRPAGGELHYVIRYIRREPLKTSYPKIAARLAEIYYQLTPQEVEAAPQSAQTFRERYFANRPQWHEKDVRSVLLDATGVGTPVVDLVRDQGVRCTAVYLTGGRDVTAQLGRLNLPKTLMISRLQVLLQSRLVHLDPSDDEAQAAAEELLNYELKVTDSANLQMGVFKTGKHDDMATALGLACWDDEARSTITVDTAPSALLR